MNTQELIIQIKAIATEEDMNTVAILIQAQPGQMAPEVQSALLEKLAEMTAKTKELVTEAKNVLLSHGVSYPLSDWLTAANYARKFSIENVATVTNWINRGIIPQENVKEIPELGLRLIKAVEYSPRAYTQVNEGKDA
ncbi:hypothetical protein [Spirosoma flavum]|uniref:Uncharacterized protein n=1 Tax=Spirosoma flavum TaxID=2048557 RepID=A0ABW6ASD8_9BACT